MLDPEPLGSPLPNYIVLGVAAVSEGTSWALALRALLRQKRGSRGVLGAVRASKDPTTFVVLMEDSAALAGIAVAALGAFLSHRLGRPWIDGAASIAIGVILGAFAFFLAYECRGLLLGESAAPEVRRDIEEVVTRSDSVERVDRLLTMQMAPDQILVNLDARFREDLGSAELARAIDQLEEDLRAVHGSVRQVFVEPAGDPEAQRAEESAERRGLPGMG